MDSEQLQLKYKPIKVCGICGDKALGYNFNAITCEACKAFFRRNALRNKDFKCPFDGNCKIDLVTRRFCQKCRLKKCFDIGMKKEWILSDDEKKVKRDKIIENRRKKETNPLSNGADYDQYSRSGEEENSPDHKPSSQCFNPDPFNSSYKLGAYHDSKELFNSLYFFEPYRQHQQYQNYLSNKALLNGRNSLEAYSPPPPPSVSSSLPNKAFVYGNDSLCTKVSPSTLPGPTVSKPAPIAHRPPPISSQHSGSSWLSVDNSNCSIKSNDSIKSSPPPPPTCFDQPNRQPVLFKARNGSSSDDQSRDKFNYKLSIDKSQTGLGQNSIKNFDPPPAGCSSSRRGNTIERRPHSSSTDSSDESETTAYNGFYNEAATAGGSSEHRSMDDISLIDASTTATTPVTPEVATASAGKRSTLDGGKLNPEPPSIYAKDNDKNGSLSPSTEAGYFPYNQSWPNISEAETEKSQCSKIENSFMTAIHRTFNLVENLRVQEVIDAFKSSKWYTQYDRIGSEILTLGDMYAAIEKTAQHCTSMASLLSTFAVLCSKDQISLLKSSVNAMMILISACTFVPSKDAWIFNLNKEKGPALIFRYSTYRKILANEPYLDEYKNFLFSFPDTWKNDPTLFDLLMAIILFNPNQPNLEHRDIIKLEYLTYRHLLQKYIDIHYTSMSATKIFLPNLLEMIDELHRLNEKMKITHQAILIGNYRPIVQL